MEKVLLASQPVRFRRRKQNRFQLKVRERRHAEESENCAQYKSQTVRLTSAMAMAVSVAPAMRSCATGLPGRASRTARKPRPSSRLRRK